MEQMDIGSLERLQKLWEGVSEWGVILVIVGVVGESVEMFLKWGEKDWFLRLFNTRIRRWINRCGEIVHPWALEVETFFFAVLVAGLLMEFRGSHMEIRYGDQISDLLKTERVKLEKEVADTKERAGNAEERAAEANKRSKELDVARLGLEKQVEDLRNENMVIEERIRDRTIQERVISLLNRIDREVLQVLASRGIDWEVNAKIESYLASEVRYLSLEEGASKYLKMLPPLDPGGVPTVMDGDGLTKTIIRFRISTNLLRSPWKISK